jgi:hypothetical protein
MNALLMQEVYNLTKRLEHFHPFPSPPICSWMKLFECLRIPTKLNRTCSTNLPSKGKGVGGILESKFEEILNMVKNSPMVVKICHNEGKLTKRLLPKVTCIF